MAILDKISDNRLNLLLKIPAIKNIIKQKIRTGLGLSKVKVVLAGAATTPESLKNWYRKFDIELQEVYGMTETCGGCVVMPKGKRKEKSNRQVIEGVPLEIEPDTQEIKSKNALVNERLL